MSLLLDLSQTLFAKGFRSFATLLILAYRTVGAPHLGGACRFQPSCSEYALQVLESQPPLRGAKLIAQRLMKCHPWGPMGFDPVKR